jgi:hypothetical protein
VSNFEQISIGDARRFATIEPLPQGGRAFLMQATRAAQLALHGNGLLEDRAAGRPG